MTESFLTSLLDFNLNPIYCYNLVLNLQIFKNNIGFYFMFIIFILQIIFFIVYIKKNVKPLRYFMLIFKNKDKKNIKSTPPQKNKINIKLNKSNNTTRNEETKDYDYNSKNILDNKNISNGKENLNYIFDLNKKNISKKGNKNLILTNNFISNFNIQNINGNNKILELIKSKNKKHLSRKKNHKNKFDENKGNRIETRIDNNKKYDIKKKKNKDIIILCRNDEDLLDMDYEYAIIYDKRPYLRIYWAFLVDNQTILGTFCTENYLHLFIIKLSFFVFTFQISFFLNAFFYTDEYISDAYHNNGVLDFISGLPKTIYSFVATLIITNLLRMLSNSKEELKRIIRKKNQNKEYVYLIDNKLRKLKHKLYTYFSLVFLLGLFFLYYVTSFCSIYHYSQKYWFIGCLESFGIDFIVAIVECIFIALLRYISLKYRIKLLDFIKNN